MTLKNERGDIAAKIVELSATKADGETKRQIGELYDKYNDLTSRMEQDAKDKDLKREAEELRSEIPDSKVADPDQEAVPSLRQLIKTKMNSGERNFSVEISPPQYDGAGEFDMKHELKRAGETYTYSTRYTAPNELELSMFRQKELYNQRDLANSSTTGIPPVDYLDIVQNKIYIGPMLNAGIVDIANVPTGRKAIAPAFLGGATASHISENAAQTINTRAPSTVEIDIYKLGSMDAVSNEVITDAQGDILGIVSDGIFRGIMSTANTFLTTGSGSSQPNGIVTALAAATNGTAAQNLNKTTPTPAELFKAVGEISSAYAGDAKLTLGKGLFVNLVTHSTAVGQATNAINPNFLSLNAVEGSLGTFWGNPVYDNPSISAIGSAKNVAVVGDHSAYHVRLGTISIEFSSHSAFEKDQVQVRGTLRYGGNLRVTPTATEKNILVVKTTT